MAATKKQTAAKAVFKVRSAESKNGGAHIKGASRDGALIAAAARDRASKRAK